MEDAAEQSLANDDSSQTNDDRATAHAEHLQSPDTGSAAPGQRHQTVGHSQTQHDIEVGVDALRRDIAGVRAGGTDGTSPARCRKNQYRMPISTAVTMMIIMMGLWRANSLTQRREMSRPYLSTLMA